MFYRLLQITCIFTLVFIAFSDSIVEAQQGVADIRVDSLSLDKTTVLLPCRPGVRPARGACNDSRVIRAKAAISGNASQGSRVDAVVSGGRTNRLGDLEFDWDLAGVMPGTYTFSATARDKDGRYGGSRTGTVTVKECDGCVHSDVCPVITVDGPSGVVSPGENMTFTANVSGGASGDTTYNWTLSAGMIVGGQGTPSIQVQTDRSLGGSTVTATVDVSNSGWMPGCSTSVSQTAMLDSLPVARLLDEFRTAGNNCEEGFARMDNFYIQLNNDPNVQGVIIVYSETSAPRSGRTRMRQLVSYTKMRKYDASRVTFIDGPLKKDATTQFWIVPPGAELPVPEAGEGTVPTVAVSTATKPYLFAGEYLDGIPGCGEPFDIGAYAAVLNNEPKSRGRIVIAETSPAKYNKKRREILTDLKANGVPATLVTIVYKRVARMRMLESTELWVIPSTKK